MRWAARIGLVIKFLFRPGAMFSVHGTIVSVNQTLIRSCGGDGRGGRLGMNIRGA